MNFVSFGKKPEMGPIIEENNSIDEEFKHDFMETRGDKRASVNVEDIRGINSKLSARNINLNSS